MYIIEVNGVAYSPAMVEALETELTALRAENACLTGERDDARENLDFMINLRRSDVKLIGTRDMQLAHVIADRDVAIRERDELVAAIDITVAEANRLAEATVAEWEVKTREIEAGIDRLENERDAVIRERDEGKALAAIAVSLAMQERDGAIRERDEARADLLATGQRASNAITAEWHRANDTADAIASWLETVDPSNDSNGWIDAAITDIRDGKWKEQSK